MKSDLRRGVVRFVVVVICLFALPSTTTTSAQTLPSGWTSSNVGSPALYGSATFQNGRFTVRAADTGIGATADQFHFVYRAESDDLDVIARVVTLQSVHFETEAGVMIRTSLSGTAAYAALVVTRSNGVSFKRRVSSGSTSSYTYGGAGAAPLWLKLQLRGATVTALRSNDGTTWTSVGQQKLPLRSRFYVGLALSSHMFDKIATGTFDHVAVLRIPASQRPSVILTAPADGAKYTAPANIPLAASARDGDGTIARVDFYAGGTLLGSDTTSPYAYTWSGAPAGTYALTAVARDNSGIATASVARTVTISPSGTNQAPLVSLTMPVAGATYIAPATIPISATASDADGTVTRVDFYTGSTLIGSDTTTPYGMTWTNVVAGLHSLTAVARDNAGAMTVSGTHDIRVDSPLLPRIAIFVPPTNHDTEVTRYVLEIFPSGANPTFANPVATQDLGKPPVVDGECRADISRTTTGLPPGTYIATVTAIGNAGSAQSAPSAPFVR